MQDATDQRPSVLTAAIRRHLRSLPELFPTGRHSYPENVHSSPFGTSKSTKTDLTQPPGLLLWVAPLMVLAVIALEMFLVDLYV